MAISTTQDRLNRYLEAEAAILGGQSYRYGDRELRRPDLEYVQKQIAYLQAAAARELAVSRGGGGRFSQADFSGVGPRGSWTQT